MRYLRRFIGFWDGFLIGGRPELLVGSVIALFLAWAAVRLSIPPAVAAPGLFALIAGVGAMSVRLRAQAHRR